MLKDYFNAKTGPIIVTVIIVALVGIFYFASGAYKEGMSENTNLNMNALDVLKDAKFKVVYEDTGIAIFTKADNDKLAKLKLDSGSIIPKDDSIVLGINEAEMMIDKKEFKFIDDQINEDGINMTIGGLLLPTDTIIDHMHFVSEDIFSKIDGEDNALAVKYKGNEPKIFLMYDMKSEKLAFILNEGELRYYYIHYINGKAYYPILIGNKEAEMMRKEKLFKNIGDTIDDFFGKNIVVVGVLADSGALDMMHIVDKNFFTDRQSGILA